MRVHCHYACMLWLLGSGACCECTIRIMCCMHGWHVQYHFLSPCEVVMLYSIGSITLFFPPSNLLMSLWLPMYLPTHILSLAVTFLRVPVNKDHLYCRCQQIFFTRQQLCGPACIELLIEIEESKLYSITERKIKTKRS